MSKVTLHIRQNELKKLMKESLFYFKSKSRVDNTVFFNKVVKVIIINITKIVYFKYSIFIATIQKSIVILIINVFNTLQCSRSMFMISVCIFVCFQYSILLKGL